MSDEEYSEEEHTKRLSATMAMLSEKYPIVVYYKKAVACGLPKHFMDLRFPPDKLGRVPCKREAMDWYLNDGEAMRKADTKHKQDLEALAEINDGKLVTENVEQNDGEMRPTTSNAK